MEYKKLGRFHIQKSLAKGGMGEVVRSVDDAGRPIALKTILDDFKDDKKFQDLFIREADITFQLRHPNIVRAFQFEKVGERLVLALEYLDGVNLKDILRQVYDKKLNIPVCVVSEIMDRVLTGLHYAHTKCDASHKSLGILHRDLNPSNVFVTYSGEVKILDFGISKATSLDVHQLTPKNELRGKICYLSPEQIAQKDMDCRSDVFSVGIVLWEALAGRPLYVRKTDAEVMEAIVQGEYLSLKEFRPDVPGVVEEVIRKALEVDPKKRFQSAEEFRLSLKQAVKAVVLPGVGEEEISVFTRSIFKKVPKEASPEFHSGFAFLMTQTRGREAQGLERAGELAHQHPTRPTVQLNYARAQLAAGDRLEGLRLMRRLARVDSMEKDVQQVLEWLGVRRAPVIKSLSRSNPVNYVLGKIRHQIMGPTPYQQEFLAA